MAFHPATAGVEAVARGAVSAEVTSSGLEHIRVRSDETLSILTDETFSGGAKAQAVFQLACDCVALIDSLELHETSREKGLGFSILEAELMANSLAAFAVSLDVPGAEDAALELLEILSVELDKLAPLLFASLVRLDPDEAASNADSKRLLRALRGVCIWILTAIAKCVGLERFRGPVLWEWASSDPTWALLLVRGALCTGIEEICDVQIASGDADFDPVIVPTCLQELKQAVFIATLDLASPTVAFDVGDDLDGAVITIQMRSAELVLHRAELAVGLVSTDMIEVLCQQAAELGPGVGADLAAFVANVLQPELSQQPEWVWQAPVMQATVREAQRAMAIFASHLVRHSNTLWQILAEVPGAIGESLPPGFLQDCAKISYLLPPNSQDFNLFTARALTIVRPGGVPGLRDPWVIAPLCILAANTGLDPEEATYLSSAVASADEAVRAGLHDRWQHWQGPPLGSNMTKWREAAALGVVQETIAPLENPTPPLVPEEVLTLPPKKGGAFSTLLREALPAYCCQISGQIMMDPVRTPFGFVCDRATLARVLVAKGGECPVTGQTLTIDQCERVPDLRKEIQVWVRQQHQAKSTGRKPQLASAAAKGACCS